MSEENKGDDQKQDSDSDHVASTSFVPFKMAVCVCCVRLSKLTVSLTPLTAPNLSTALTQGRGSAAAPTGPTGRSGQRGRAQSSSRQAWLTETAWLTEAAWSPRPAPGRGLAPSPSQAGRTAGWGLKAVHAGTPRPGRARQHLRGLPRPPRRQAQPQGPRRLLAPRTSRKTRAASLTVRFRPTAAAR